MSILSVAISRVISVIRIATMGGIDVSDCLQSNSKSTGLIRKLEIRYVCR